MIVTNSLQQKTFAERLEQQSFGFWFLIGTVLFTITQLARWLVIATEQKIFLNDKFAFSLNVSTSLMYGLYFVAMIFIGHYLFTHWQRMFVISKLGFLLIITGGISNVVERIFNGAVVDYFYIANGVLNLADFYIIIGIILIFLQRGYKESSSKLE